MEGESWRLDEVDEMSPENLHVQSVVRATSGDRTGIGVLEQIVVGPYPRYGFTEFPRPGEVGLRTGRPDPHTSSTADRPHGPLTSSSRRRRQSETPPARYVSVPGGITPRSSSRLMTRTTMAQ